MKVYLLVEMGTWDLENEDEELVFMNFEKAKEEFYKKVEQAKIDMLDNWLDEENCEIEETYNDEEKHYYFCIYENGDYSRLHDTISLQEIEVIE